MVTIVEEDIIKAPDINMEIGHIYRGKIYTLDNAYNNYYIAGKIKYTDARFMINLSNGSMLPASHFFDRQLEDITDKVFFDIPVIRYGDNEILYDTFSKLNNDDIYLVGDTYLNQNFKLFMVVEKEIADKYNHYIVFLNTGTIKPLNSIKCNDNCSDVRCRVIMSIKGKEIANGDN